MFKYRSDLRLEDGKRRAEERVLDKNGPQSRFGRVSNV